MSRFPAVEQDLALIVDDDVTAGALQRAIEAAPLVREARVFDVYTGDQVPAGKKSVAFAVQYQSDDHTLTDDEVAKAQRKILERLRREFWPSCARSHRLRPLQTSRSPTLDPARRHAEQGEASYRA